MLHGTDIYHLLHGTLFPQAAARAHRDDHEITNDAFRTGAENHTPGDEGVYARRKRDAVRAFHEWIPIRSRDMSDPANFEANRIIFRTFEFGGLATFVATGGRIAAREE